MKTTLIRPFAQRIASKIRKDSRKAVADQNKIRQRLIQKAKKTLFGKDHDFEKIENYSDFKKRIPIKDYEGLSDYFEKVKDGKSDILWPGKPKYFAKTSGTTSGIKYIPVSHDSVPNHINTARNALFNYIGQNRKSKI